MQYKRRSSEPTKVCQYCYTEKPLSEFCSHVRDKYACKDCKTLLNRLVRFRLHPEDYDMLLEKQDYKCAICSRLLLLQTKQTVVDHCHETSLVRGVLCRMCNTALGQFSDDPNLLQRALEYLHEPTANFVRQTETGENARIVRDYYRKKQAAENGAGGVD